MADGDQHVYHHNDETPRLNVSVEKNSRGYNWSATVVGAKSVEEALQLLADASGAMETTYGVSGPPPTTHVITKK